MPKKSSKRKKTTRKKSTKKVPSFGEDCAEFRKAKIAEKKAKKAINAIGKRIKDYAFKNELDKGDYNGVKLIFKYKFSNENVEIAKNEGVEVPLVKFVTLNLTEERIQSLIDEGLIREDEITRSESPDLKALEKIFEESGIEGVFEQSIALGLSTVE